MQLDYLLERISEFLRMTVVPVCQNVGHEVSHACSECTGRILMIVMGGPSNNNTTDGTNNMSKFLTASTICNVFLFWAALFLWGHPTMGFAVGLTSWMSLLHVTLLWMTIKKSPALSGIMERYSSQFLLGAFAGGSLVLTVMLLTVSVYLSSAAGKCVPIYDVGAHVATSSTALTTASSTGGDYECYSSHHFAMRMASFFSGMIVVLDGGLTKFLFSQNEDYLGLSEWSSHQYDTIGGGDGVANGNANASSNINSRNGYHSTPSAP
jgi:hypothetical protein